MEQYYSIKQLAEKIGIPYSTLDRYVKIHGRYLKTSKKHKSVLVAEESIKTLEKIRTLYADKATAEEVDDALGEQGIPVTITVPTDDEKLVKMDLGAVMTLLGEQQQQNHLALMRQQESYKAEIMMKQEQDKAELLAKQQQDKEELLQEMNRIEEERKTRALERDEKLMSGLKQILEAHKEVAAAQQVQKNWLQKLLRL